MKKIVLFDPSCGTLNAGDYIISNAARSEIQDIIKDSFVLTVSTHNPTLTTTQQLRASKQSKYFNNADLKFLLGSNILKPNMLHLRNDWNMNIFDCKPYKSVILVGAGFDGDTSSANLYTKLIYKKILNREITHSVRDKKTEQFLKKMGFKATNTGCPTIWQLTKEHCAKIPKEKSKNVVFTLTDYRKDLPNDQSLINILQKNYKKLYFWIQGSEDLDYLKSLKNTNNIELIAPTFETYKAFLETHDCDYVGTRLHAGIQAMRCYKRSVILIVDNRARDMKETYNLPAIERNNIQELDSIINSRFSTDIEIDEQKIAKWKEQFE